MMLLALGLLLWNDLATVKIDEMIDDCEMKIDDVIWRGGSCTANLQPQRYSFRRLPDITKSDEKNGLTWIPPESLQEAILWGL
ncbi:unnamed protein product [Rhodiola kirilowii]